MTEPWYRDGLRFHCTRCGNCCTGDPGYVWLSDVEIARLAEFLELPQDEVLARYCRKIGTRWSLRERRTRQGNYDCIFLKEVPVESVREGGQRVMHLKRICEVYEVRPLQCRTWPFWEGNLANESRWKDAATRCPGMNVGRKYSRDQIVALRDATEWPQITSPAAAPEPQPRAGHRADRPRRVLPADPGG